MRLEKNISILLTILFFTSLITGMEMPPSSVLQVPIQQLKQPMIHSPAQSLAYLCCKKIASEWAQIKELNQEQLAYIQSLNTSLSHEVRDLLAQEIVRCTHPKKLCTLPERGKFSPDGSRVLLKHNSYSGSLLNFCPGLHMHCAVSGKKLFTIDDASRFFPFEWSPQGTYIWAEKDRPYRAEPGVHIWRAEDGQLLHQLFPEQLGAIIFTPDDKYVVMKDPQGYWGVLNMQTGKSINDIARHSFTSIIPAQDPQGKWILITDKNDDQESVIIDIDTLEHNVVNVAEIGKVPGRVTYFSPDGSHFISLNEGAYDLYNRTLQLVHRFENEKNGSQGRININKQRIGFGMNLFMSVYSLCNHEFAVEYQQSPGFSHRSVFASSDLSKKITLVWQNSLPEKPHEKQTTVSIYERGEKRHEWVFPKIIETISYTPDSRIIALKSGVLCDEMQLLNIETGQTMSLWDIRQIISPIDIMLQRFSSDGKFFIKTDRIDNTLFYRLIPEVEVWQLHTNEKGEWQLPIEADPEKAKTIPLEDIMKLVLAYNKKTED